MVQIKNPSPGRIPSFSANQKIVLKRKRSSIAKPASSTEKKSPTKSFPKSPIRSSPRKVANPFRKQSTTPCKKAKIDLRLGSPIKRMPKIESDSPKSTKSFNSSKNENYGLVDFSTFISSRASTSSAVNRKLDFSAPKKELTDIPMDLRPGFKLRLSSQKPFPMLKEGKAKALSEVVFELGDIVAAKKAVIGADLELNHSNILEGLSSMAKLRAGTYYYQYPDLSEFHFTMFPRLEAQSRLSGSSKSKPSLQQMGQIYVDGIHVKWKKTLEDLFNDWKLTSRRSFYLFAPNTTILFTKYANLECNENTWADPGKPQLRIIITPTTSGLRQIMRDKGISFDLPFSGRRASRRVSKNNSSLPLDDNNTLAGLDNSFDKSFEVKPVVIDKRKTPVKPFKSENLLDTPNDDDHFDNDEWLKDLGISPRSHLGFRRHNTISDYTVHSSLSNLPPSDVSQGCIDSSAMNDATRSTAVITDAESIEIFFNYAMTSKDFTASTGTQAGLPPTLVASQNFENGALKSLDISSQIVKRSRDTKHEYIIEVDNGPILPYMPSMLISFIQSIPELCVKENEVKVTVSGRSAYLGFNESIDPESFFNYSEFTYNLATNKFEV